ncbi:MAG: FAD-binding oxidoreductase [Nanoarchaeota archaeon]
MLTFKGKVVEKKQLTDDVILLSLAAPEEFTFQAGQFVTLRIEKGSEYKLKSYSILNPPSQKGRLDLCIKIIDGGFASEVFLETKVGDQFEVKGPLGHFVFDDKDKNKELWFVGTGTGVAPLYSMIKEGLTKKYNKKYVLLFSVRSKKDIFLDEMFRSLAKKYANFTYMPTLTREEWEGATGRVYKHLPEDAENKTFYICGLKEFVLEVKDFLIKKDVCSEYIKYERYS